LFWLFDVLYDVKEDPEVYTNIISYRKIRKLLCVLDYSGNLNFLKQSFFGSKQLNIELKQPSVLEVKTTTRSPQVILATGDFYFLFFFLFSFPLLWLFLNFLHYTHQKESEK
jgi:hypothetical protein